MAAEKKVLFVPYMDFEIMHKQYKKGKKYELSLREGFRLIGSGYGDIYAEPYNWVISK